LEFQAVRAKLSTQRRLLAAKRLAATTQLAEETTRNALRQQLARSDAQFPSLSQSAEFLASIDATAMSAGCRLVAVDLLPRQEPIRLPGRPDPSPLPTTAKRKDAAADNETTQGTRSPVKLRARLSLVGMYTHIVALLAMIETSSQVAHVEQLTLALASKDGSELNASFVLNLLALPGKENEQP
jgi:type IV secretory pathway VirB10-like protein